MPDDIYTVWRCKLFRNQIVPHGVWCKDICGHFDPRHTEQDVIPLCNKAHCIVVDDSFRGDYARGPTNKAHKDVDLSIKLGIIDQYI